MGVLIGCVVAIPIMFSLLWKSEVVGIALLVLGLSIALYLLYFALKSETVVRDRIIALLILLLCNVAFWACFEQAGNSLNIFAANHIHHLRIDMFSWTMLECTLFRIRNKRIIGKKWATTLESWQQDI